MKHLYFSNRHFSASAERRCIYMTMPAPGPESAPDPRKVQLTEALKGGVERNEVSTDLRQRVRKMIVDSMDPKVHEIQDTVTILNSELSKVAPGLSIPADLQSPRHLRDIVINAKYVPLAAGPAGPSAVLSSGKEKTQTPDVQLFSQLWQEAARLAALVSPMLRTELRQRRQQPTPTLAALRDELYAVLKQLGPIERKMYQARMVDVPAKAATTLSNLQVMGRPSLVFGTLANIQMLARQYRLVQEGEVIQDFNIINRTTGKSEMVVAQKDGLFGDYEDHMTDEQLRPDIPTRVGIITPEGGIRSSFKRVPFAGIGATEGDDGKPLPKRFTKEEKTDNKVRRTFEVNGKKIIETDRMYSERVETERKAAEARLELKMDIEWGKITAVSTEYQRLNPLEQDRIELQVPRFVRRLNQTMKDGKIRDLSKLEALSKSLRTQFDSARNTVATHADFAPGTYERTPVEGPELAKVQNIITDVKNWLNGKEASRQVELRTLVAQLDIALSANQYADVRRLTAHILYEAKNVLPKTSYDVTPKAPETDRVLEERTQALKTQLGLHMNDFMKLEDMDKLLAKAPTDPDAKKQLKTVILKELEGMKTLKRNFPELFVGDRFADARLTYGRYVSPKVLTEAQWNGAVLTLNMRTNKVTTMLTEVL